MSNKDAKTAKGAKTEENRFTKEQILASKSLGYNKDLVQALLASDRTYTLKEVESSLNNFLKRKVK